MKKGSVGQTLNPGDPPVSANAPSFFYMELSLCLAKWTFNWVFSLAWNLHFSMAGFPLLTSEVNFEKAPWYNATLSRVTAWSPFHFGGLFATNSGQNRYPILGYQLRTLWTTEAEVTVTGQDWGMSKGTPLSISFILQKNNWHYLSRISFNCKWHELIQTGIERKFKRVLGKMLIYVSLGVCEIQELRWYHWCHFNFLFYPYFWPCSCSLTISRLALQSVGFI